MFRFSAPSLFRLPAALLLTILFGLDPVAAAPSLGAGVQQRPAPKKPARPAPAAARKPLPGMDHVRARVGEARTRIQSVFYEVTHRYQAGGGPEREVTYDWAASGRRFYARRVKDTGISVVGRCEGGRLYETEYSPGPVETARVKRHGYSVRGGGYAHRHGGPDPFEGAIRLRGAWIDELLQRGTWAADLGPDHPEFGRTVRVTGTDARGIRCDLRFAPDRDWLCVRAVLRLPPAPNRPSAPPVETETELVRMVANGTTWLPTRLRHAEYSVGPTGRAVLRTDALKAAPRDLNIVPATLFAPPPLVEGMYVDDLDTGQIYRVQNGRLVLRAR